jgi:hypothetical protein
MKISITPLMLLLALLVSFNAISGPKLNSLPSAPATIYLDFDGYYVNSPDWNNGVPFQADSAGMTDAQITEVFNRVSEDYRPFSVNITTDSMVFNSAPATQRIRVVVTPTSAWYPGVGGITYVGSFTWGDETPCFVFCDLLGPNDPKMVGECCAHEAGHSLGLYHQSTWDSACDLLAVYSTGDGTGEASWAPIMGDSYYNNMTGWYNGLTPYACTLAQDDLGTITTQNGFSYRPDDYSATLNSSATVLNMSGASVGGIISTNTDQDAFQFTMSKNSSVYLNVSPYSVGANDDGADLDVKILLYDANNNLLNTYDPPSIMSVTVDTTLNAGNYYMVVEGSGNPYVSGYGSLGAYTITGLSTVLPIQGITLTGKTDNNAHDLSWNIIATSVIRSIVVEYSTDGKDFSSLNAVSPSSTSFTYTPFENNDIYYRIKVTSVEDQTSYSNVIILKAITRSANVFNVSTLVYSDISVNASENFQYELNTINGTLLVKGNGIQGLNKLNINNQPNGIYILQLSGSNGRQVERIIKQ